MTKHFDWSNYYRPLQNSPLRGGCTHTGPVGYWILNFLKNEPLSNTSKGSFQKSIQKSISPGGASGIWTGCHGEWMGFVVFRNFLLKGEVRGVLEWGIRCIINRMGGMGGLMPKNRKKKKSFRFNFFWHFCNVNILITEKITKTKNRPNYPLLAKYTSVKGAPTG